MKNRLTALVQDRLVWFIALGVVLFAIDAAARRDDETRILVDLPLVEKLVAQWQGQTKRPPTAPELDALIEGYIREEILVREAQRMGLAGDDVIIRRRLAQKVEFFLSENDPPALPDEAVLKAWFDDNRARYDKPPSISWQHVFAADESAAQEMVKKLRQDEVAWRQMGQPFMLNRAYARHDKHKLAQLMGGDFARSLMAEKSNDWFGPVRSAYGWHAVKLTGRTALQAAQFQPLVEKIAVDWQDDKAREAKQKAWLDLRASYHIELVPVSQ